MLKKVVKPQKTEAKRFSLGRKMRRTAALFTTKVRQFATQPAFTYALTVFAISITFPLQAHASPLDQGLMQMQTFFTGTLAKAASLIAIVIGGYSFAHGEPGAKKPRRRRRRHGIAIMAANVLTWLWGPSTQPPFAVHFTFQHDVPPEGLMPETTAERHNRVFKSLHRPLTYMGIERTFFSMLRLGGGDVQPFQFTRAGAGIHRRLHIFGYWVTNSDPAFLKILGHSREVQTALRRRQTTIPKVEMR